MMGEMSSPREARAVFKVVETDRRIEIRMSATPEGVVRTDVRLRGYLANRLIPVDVFAVRILAREALLNAVTHGSGGDPGRLIRFAVDVGAEHLFLEVEDSGEGFDWRSRPRDFDSLALQGRGLYLMELYSDGVWFNEKGNRVLLRKNFAAGARRPRDESGLTSASA